MPDLDTPAAAYRYLDFYRRDDHTIFFGRRRETEILLADIISARFVVLFARTGTGKSSLINAGVVPRLEKLEYETVLTRVGNDPAAAVLSKLELPPAQRLAEALTAHVDSTERPLVVFFDQFEEFFLGGVAAETQQSFLAEIGALYRNSASGVHVVFSLREDFLARMAMFRAEIPTIFQTESQLWLRPLTVEQTREGIEGPAAVLGFEYERGLTDAILADVPREDGLISTIDMQIVCDTLWRGKRGNVITFELYESLGRAGGILRDRIFNDLAELDAPQLLTLERVIPQLSTPDDTKRPRTLDELQEATGTDAKTLRDLIDALVRLHLVNLDERRLPPVVEWVSDHVSKLSGSLTPGLQRAWLRKHRAKVEQARLTELLSHAALVSSLDTEDWYRLLNETASRDTLGLWFANTPKLFDAYGLLGRHLADDSTTEDAAHRLMLFLGEKDEPRAIAILEEQLRDRRRARAALRALTVVGNDRAVKAIQRVIDDGELRDNALDALRVIDSTLARSILEGAPSREPAWWERVVSFASGKKSEVHGMAGRRWADVAGQLDTMPEVCGVILGPDLPSADPVIAKQLAEKIDYPFKNRTNLLKVVDYAEATFGEGWRKAAAGIPLFSSDAATFYARVVDLSVGLYVTTSLGRDLDQALLTSGRRPQQRGWAVGGPVCGTSQRPILLRVHEAVDEEASDRRDDEVHFSSHRPQLLIAMGFDVSRPDLDVLVAQMGRAQYVMISPPPELSSDRRAFVRANDYLNQASRKGKIVYWGTPVEFLDELRLRMRR